MYKTVTLAALLVAGAPEITLCPACGQQPPISRETVRHVRSRAYHPGWRSFPIRIAFIANQYDTPDREEAALAGFDLWREATDHVVSYVRVSSPERAQVSVRFDSTVSGGHTMMRFSGSTLYRARMVIGTRDGDLGDVECTAAHEFGHALGIQVHSADRGDLMYPIHMVGEPCHITPGDLALLRRSYPRMRSSRDTSASQDRQAPGQ